MRFHISRTRALLPLLCTALWSPLHAQQHDHPARSTGALGTVHFATSCAAAVSAQFDRAVALLHSFEFGESIREFNAVLAADPSCAMAHWGLAMSQWSNPFSGVNRGRAQLQRGQASADAAMQVAASVTPRERGYIAAVSTLYTDHDRIDQPSRIIAYERAMADLVAQQPTDIEAKIFHALALVATAPATDKTYELQRRAGATLERLWSAQPNHPGLAHYIIHSYDVPALAAQATAAAERYSVIAPAAAHALHMPSHTFTRLGMWNESVRMNRRSAEAAHATGSLAEELHASDYLTYAHLQMQQLPAVRAILAGLPAIASRFDPAAITGAAPGSAGVFALAAIPARYALERRNWTDAAALVVRPSSFPHTDAMTHFTRALGQTHLKRLDDARASIESLAEMQRRLQVAREGYWAEQVAIQHQAAQAWLTLTLGQPDSALRALRAAADREDATEKSAVTPGPLVPARELLGDMLMEVRRPADALVEYRRTLTKEPGRYRATDGALRAATAIGDRKAIAQYSAARARLTATSPRRTSR
ncbi:MAG: hypothetical protein V4813_03345 [Gemmatimonadota bacterium]